MNRKNEIRRNNMFLRNSKLFWFNLINSVLHYFLGAVTVEQSRLKFKPRPPITVTRLTTHKYVHVIPYFFSFIITIDHVHVQRYTQSQLYRYLYWHTPCQIPSTSGKSPGIEFWSKVAWAPRQFYTATANSVVSSMVSSVASSGCQMGNDFWSMLTICMISKSYVKRFFAIIQY